MTNSAGGLTDGLNVVGNRTIKHAVGVKVCRDPRRKANSRCPIGIGVWEQPLPLPLRITDYAVFDFSAAMQRLICHIRASCPELVHVQPDRMMIAYMQTRSPGAHGVYASVLPLRFEGGEVTTKRRGRTYAMPRLFRSKHGVVSAMAACSLSDLPRPQAGVPPSDGIPPEAWKGRGEGVEPAEILYIVYFALPRFANLDFDAKLTTIFHELYHISPEFNGDIRRFPGKNYAHGHSRKRYNERVRALAEAYVTTPGADEHTAFLRLSFDELTAHHGRVVGTRIRPPRPRPVHTPPKRNL